MKNFKRRTKYFKYSISFLLRATGEAVYPLPRNTGSDSHYKVKFGIVSVDLDKDNCDLLSGALWCNRRIKNCCDIG